MSGVAGMCGSAAGGERVAGGKLAGSGRDMPSSIAKRRMRLHRGSTGWEPTRLAATALRACFMARGFRCCWRPPRPCSQP